jgi:hypothetical protein
MLRRAFGLLEKVPDVFAMYGWEGTVVFQSHPGVMAISKLLDQKSIVQYRATFDQDIVDEMKEFDDELPRKAQIALDNKLPINWRALDFIEDELPRLLEEKKQLDAARKQVIRNRKLTPRCAHQVLIIREFNIHHRGVSTQTRSSTRSSLKRLPSPSKSVDSVDVNNELYIQNSSVRLQ